MLTSTCLALKTMPCAPSPMRPKMQYCSMALSPFPGTGSFRVSPPRLPPQTRLPSNGAETSARARRPRATRDGVRAFQCLSLGPRHRASVRFTQRKSSVRRPCGRERWSPLITLASAEHVTSDARSRNGAGPRSPRAKPRGGGKALSWREGGAALPGGAGPPSRGRGCGAEGVAERLQGGAGSSPRRPGSLRPLT